MSSLKRFKQCCVYGAVVKEKAIYLYIPLCEVFGWAEGQLLCQ
jgi:hypothetical protein